MPRDRNATARACLAAAATLTVLWMAVAIYGLVRTGAFHADYYYLPIREFVPASQQDAMERLVIDRYNAAQRRASVLQLCVLVPQLTFILIARRACGASGTTEAAMR